TKKPAIMLAIKEQVLFPYQNTHFDVSSEKSLQALNKALGEDKTIFVATQRHANTINVGPKDIFRVGVVAQIKQIIKLPNNIIRVVVSVVERKEIDAYINIQPCFEVLLKDIVVPEESDRVIEATFRGLKSLLEDYKKLDPKKNFEPLQEAAYENPEKMVYALASIIFASENDKLKILSEPSLLARMEECAVKIANEIDLVGIERNLQSKVKKRVEKNQREYYLKEQQKVISEELGDNEDDIIKYREKIAALAFPKDMEERVLKEVSRLQSTPSQSPEYGVIRAYLDTVVELPWKTSSEQNFDLKSAKASLDNDHYGLEKVKERIIEYLAVNKLTNTLKAPILCFVGPPGVGKTSIVSSIAKASGRKFVSMSLGGVRDEAEIRGHRRTYIGSMCGRLLSGLRNIKVNNPVFLLDEIDKMSSDFRGDPGSALLEVLDPNQNHEFKDHYLELPFDLSKVMFVTTANSLDTIPLPLLDRMEVIELSGYTYEEKQEIAKKYLVPKQIENNGLTNDNIVFLDTAIKSLIYSHTSESGVRNLERQIGAVCRKVAVGVVSGEKEKAIIATLEKYLGPPKIAQKQKRLFDEIGVATGLAWTAVGGKTLNVEVVAIKGKGDIKLTGQLGEVMQESCYTALSLVKSRAEKYKINPEDFAKYDLHIHFPEGATKKDGPSAGITIATAIASVFCKRAVDCKVAMTGEVTLTGRVLAIGGLKEKSLAALRDGVTTLILAKENEKDIEEIPKSVQEKIKIKWVGSIDEVFEFALKK
ncbi:MAG: endopeptidase La, partial [Firmicutes bacterium]|nr:endopeptidase La [Bacillota bacterium]